MHIPDDETEFVPDHPTHRFTGYVTGGTNFYEILVPTGSHLLLQDELSDRLWQLLYHVVPEIILRGVGLFEAFLKGCLEVSPVSHGELTTLRLKFGSLPTIFVRFDRTGGHLTA